MIRREDTYKIGNLGKPHGVRGEIAFLFDDDVFDRADADYLFVEIDGLLVPFFIEEYRFRSDDVALMKFEGIDSEEQAVELTGCGVWFPRALGEAAGSEVSVSKAEAIGYGIVDSADGKTIGTLTAVDDSTANPLFVVATEKGEVLIPANADLVKSIDRQARTITVDIPDGLLSL